MLESHSQEQEGALRYSQAEAQNKKEPSSAFWKFSMLSHYFKSLIFVPEKLYNVVGKSNYINVISFSQTFSILFLLTAICLDLSNKTI